MNGNFRNDTLSPNTALRAVRFSVGFMIFFRFGFARVIVASPREGYCILSSFPALREHKLGSRQVAKVSSRVVIRAIDLKSLTIDLLCFSTDLGSTYFHLLSTYFHSVSPYFTLRSPYFYLLFTYFYLLFTYSPLTRHLLFTYSPATLA